MNSNSPFPIPDRVEDVEEYIQNWKQEQADNCECYKCSETIYLDDGSIKNNMEHHTYGMLCDTCGSKRTKYLDLGRKGRYVCSECR